MALGRFIIELQDSFYHFLGMDGPSPEAATASSALVSAFTFSQPLLEAIVRWCVRETFKQNKWTLTRMCAHAHGVPVLTSWSLATSLD